MARDVPANVQTLLETDTGQEIIVILEVFWSGSNSSSTFYADREIAGHPEVKSSILSLSNVDAAVQISQGGQSKSVSATIDDTDGEIKEVFDSNDIHKAPCQVWFYVNGTDFDTDKFSIFLGQINSPIKWSEGERTFEIQIINRIEDVEVGFSAEEGAFVQLPEELIGRPWPLCFGTVTNVPALRAAPSISGTLARGVGIADFTLQNRIVLAEQITCPQTPIGFKCATSGPSFQTSCTVAYEQDASCQQARCLELERTKLRLQEEKQFEYDHIIVFGGEKFPQGFQAHHVASGRGGGPGTSGPLPSGGGSGTLGSNASQLLTLNINGGLFDGFFDGTPANPSNRFVIRGRQHPLYDPATGTVKRTEIEAELESLCSGGFGGGEDSDYIDGFNGPLYTGLRSSRISWENYRNADRANFFWSRGGSTVTLESSKEIVYIANLVPSTILSVKAKRFLNGAEFLVTVPSEFYEVRQVDFNGYDVMEIVFQRPLSSENQAEGGGWSDEIFVTQTSSVGPNTVDIIRWFIETYTDFAIDSTSFNTVRDEIDTYRMDFPLLTRPNIINILQSIARLARCAIWQRDDTFFIKYLAKEPTAITSIEESDVLKSGDAGEGPGTLVITTTATNDLVTDSTATWRKDHAIPEPNKSILRHNVNRYGTHDAEESYFTFAFLDLVRKSQTFWLIRSANTWKKLAITVSLEFAFLEPFDAVLVDIPSIANRPVMCVIERAVLDSKGKHVNLEIWTPVKLGEMEAYDFAFPANISEHALYPTIEDRNAKHAGSGKEPNFSVIAPPGHPMTPDQNNVISGFGLGCNGDGSASFIDGCRQDFGDQKPSDIGDKKPTPDTSVDQTGSVSSRSSPISNGAGDGPFSVNRFVEDWAKKTEGDSGRARETAETGGSGSSVNDGGDGKTQNPQTHDGGDLTEDDLNSLPDAEDESLDCRFTVTVTGFPTKDFGSKIGGRTVCVPSGQAQTEKYAFDSLAAALVFCETIKGGPSCKGYAPCGKCINGCGLSSTHCPDGNEGPGNIIGFTPDPGGGPPLILQ